MSNKHYPIGYRSLLLFILLIIIFFWFIGYGFVGGLPG